MANDALLEELDLRRLDLPVRAVAEAGRDAVDRHLARDQVLLEAPRRFDPRDRVRCERRVQAVTRDCDDVFDRKRGAVEYGLMLGVFHRPRGPVEREPMLDSCPRCRAHSAYVACRTGRHATSAQEMARCPQLMRPLDETDRKILALLRENGKRTFADMGSHVSLSVPAVKRRVDRLERDGVIRGYAALIDTSKLGDEIDVVVEVHVA